MAEVLLTPAVITALYRSHGDQVWRRARAIIGNDEEARDLLQEVFLSLWKNPAAFAGRSAPSTFLYAVTTRAALSRLRNTKTRTRLASLHLVVDGEPTAKGPTAADHAELRAIMGRLPEHIAEVVAYVWVDGMSQDEIASLLGITRPEVAARLARFDAFTKDVQHRERR